MKIRVTAQHIEYGKRCEPGTCPIARAFQSVGVPHVAAGPDFIDFYAADCELDLIDTVALPPRCVEFIRCFDDNRPVEPFAFEVEVPPAAFCSPQSGIRNPQFSL